jgi:hypothetical protein
MLEFCTTRRTPAETRIALFNGIPGVEELDQVSEDFSSAHYVAI